MTDLQTKSEILRTPFRELDRLIGGGLRPGFVSVLFGPPSNAKSYLALNMLTGMQREGIKVSYLPLEYDRMEHARRCLAIWIGSWGAMSENEEDKAMVLEFLRLNEDVDKFFENVSACIEENRARIQIGEDGRPTIATIDYDIAAEMVSDLCMKSKLVIVDPITAIEASESKRQNEWTQQTRFIKECKALAAHHKCHIMLLSHSGKRQKHKGQEAALSMDDLSGSAALTRFCQYLFILDYHDERTSSVRRSHGTIEQIAHRRTMIVGKCNFGSGKGAKLALDFTHGPRMDVFGTIKNDD